MEKIESYEKYLDSRVITAYIIEYDQALIFAILILIIGRWIAKIVTGFARRALTRAHLDPTLVAFLGNILFAILFAFVIIAALSQLGVETTSLAAAFAAAGLAIGLALQGSLSNFAAGVIIIAFRPFRKGDSIDAAGTSGTVEDVGIFHTILRAPDSRIITVPNSSITSDNIVNYSTRDTHRVDLLFSIGYNDDLQKVKQVLKDIADADARVLKEPAPFIGINELAESSVNIAFRPWVKTTDYWAVHDDVLEVVKLRFDAEGISLPYPQRDVHLYEEKRLKQT